MPGTTSTVLPSFSHDQHHETDAAKRKRVGGSPKQEPIGMTGVKFKNSEIMTTDFNTWGSPDLTTNVQEVT